MAEFLEAGYQDIRDHVENTWTYVEAEVTGKGDHITIEVKSDKGKDKKDKAEIKKIIKSLRKLVGKE